VSVDIHIDILLLGFRDFNVHVDIDWCGLRRSGNLNVNVDNRWGGGRRLLNLNVDVFRRAGLGGWNDFLNDDGYWLLDDDWLTLDHNRIRLRRLFCDDDRGGCWSFDVLSSHDRFACRCFDEDRNLLNDGLGDDLDWVLFFL